MAATPPDHGKLKIVERFRLARDRFPFLRNVVVLASGTVMGQAIVVLSLPLLTRLYDPAMFGLLGVYAALIMVMSAAGCLRLELAIPLPERDEDAVNILVLCIATATIIALGVALALLAWPAQAARLLGQPAILPYLWLIPTGLWFACTYSAVQFWSIRKARFGQVAQTQLVRAVAGVSTQAGFGLFNPTPFGLLFGHLLYSGLGSAGLARRFWMNDRALLGAVDRSALARNFRAQHRFPLYSVPETLLDNAANNLPLVLVAATAGTVEAGFMFLALRVSNIPIGLIGGSMSRVYLAEAAKRHREGTLGPFTRRLMGGLLVAGAIPFLVMGLVSPLLFPFIFGEEWARAGVMVAWIAFPMALQFLASPVSTILSATQNQHIGLLLQAFGFVAAIGAILLARQLAPELAFEAFACGLTLYYAAYVGVVLFLSRK